MAKPFYFWPNLADLAFLKAKWQPWHQLLLPTHGNAMECIGYGDYYLGRVDKIRQKLHSI